MNAMAKLLVALYVLVSTLVLCWIISPPFADALESTHYQFVESSLGGLGTANSNAPSSLNYQNAQSSGAELGLGTSTSTNYQIEAGNTTTKDPALTSPLPTPHQILAHFRLQPPPQPHLHFR